MTLSKCPKGHFYDGDKYTTCPHCASSSSEDKATMAVNDVTTGSFAHASETGGPTVAADQTGRTMPFQDEDVTVGYFHPTKPAPDAEHKASQASAWVEPTVGWLVCIKGASVGKDFRLKSGRNFIGRSKEMDITLENELSVSRDRHAIVIYDPKQNVYLVQPGESKSLFYLNGELVINATKLTRGDILEIGDVSLLFVPLCDENFSWQKDAEE